MKVIGKQRNSKMCMICGLDNEYGVGAPFYNMEDSSVMTVFKYKEQHQSYPGRVHGGLITAMLDEMGIRAFWAKENSEEQFGVTTTLETKYRKPVPYETKLIGRAEIVKDTSRYFVAEACIMDVHGTVLANGTINYIKLDMNRINKDVEVGEEMAYETANDLEEINFIP